MNSPLLTAREAAQMLRISTKRLHLWVNRCQIPAYRLQGTKQIRLHRNELLDWLMASQRAPKGEPHA